MIITTKNSYQAAYYIAMGGTFVKCESKRQKANKWKKTNKFGFNHIWHITLDNVPEEAVRNWGAGTALIEVQAFQHARYRLKELIKKYENRT